MEEEFSGSGVGAGRKLSGSGRSGRGGALKGRGL